MFRASQIAAISAVALALGACGPKIRVRSTQEKPVESSEADAQKLLSQQIDMPLPPPTMDPKAMRTALRDISAKQRKGEGSRVLDEYGEKAQAEPTLENRFLSAAAISDDESSWKSLYEIAKQQQKFYWVHAGMAAIYARWKTRDQAEKEIARCFELGPEIPYTYVIRGNLYRNLGLLELAVRDYATALRADPTDADARTGLALSRKSLGQSDGLRVELERSLRDLPTQYDAAETLALLLDEQNQLAAARKALEHVEELNPKNRGAKLALARLRGDENVEGAITAYEQASKLQALTKNEQEALTRLYRKADRTADEIKSLQVIQKLDPKDVAPLRRLAEIYEGKRDLPNMEATYKAILALDDKDVASIYGLGRVAEIRNQIKGAMEKFHAVKNLGDPRADADLVRLIAACQIPATPLSGSNLTSFYRAVSASLEKLYNQKLKDAPSLKGSLKAKIVTDGLGKALSIDVVENSVADPFIEAHLHYVLVEAAWPKLKATEPKKFALTFDLPPAKE